MIFIHVSETYAVADLTAGEIRRCQGTIGTQVSGISRGVQNCPRWILIHVIDRDVLAVSSNEVVGRYLGDVGGAYSDPGGNSITADLAIGGAADRFSTLIEGQRCPLDAEVEPVSSAGSYRKGTGIKGRGGAAHGFCDKDVI